MKFKFKKILLIYCVFKLTCVLPLPALAETTEDKEAQLPLFPELDEKDIKVEPERKPPFAFLDKPQKTISSGFENFVRRTDEFFANEKVFYDTSGSYMRLTGEAVYLEGGEQGYYSDLKLKVKLPATEKKLSLLVESNPGEEEEEIEKALEETPQEAVKEKDYFAGIQATYGKTDEWQFKPSIGVKLSRDPDYYARYRITRDVPLNTGYFRFREAIYWFDSTGWESDTSGEFNLRFLDKYLFRSTTGINWLEEPEVETEDVTLRQIFSLTHKLSERRALSYQLRFDGFTEPAIHTTKYSILVHYRQNLHEDYLFMDLIPKITYLKENDFRADYSFTFRMEMVFKR